MHRPWLGFWQIVGILVASASVGGGVLLEGGELSSYAQLTSLMIVAGGVVTAGIAVRARRIVAASVPRPVAADRRFDAMARGAVMAGVLGTIMGLIHVMENLDKPDNIGPGIAVAFTAMVHGIALWLLLSGLRHAVGCEAGERSRGDAEGGDGLETASLALASVCMLLFLTFVVLYAIGRVG